MADRYQDRNRRWNRYDEDDWDEYGWRTDRGDWRSEMGRRSDRQGYNPSRYYQDYNRGYNRYGYRSAYPTRRDYGSDWQPERGWRSNFDREQDWGDERRDWNRGSSYGYNRFGEEGDYDRGWDRGIENEYSRRGTSGQSYEEDWDADRSGRFGSWNRGANYTRDSGYGRGYGREYDQGYGSRGSRRYSQYNEPEDRRSMYQRDFDQEEWDEEDYEPTTWTYTEYWVIPGPYSGIGPKGWQRSDERIMEDVCDRLSQHGRIDASDIELEVNNSEIYLRGTVDNRETKRMVEDLVESISGVSDVHNELRVRNRTGEHRQMSAGRVTGQSESTAGTNRSISGSGSAGSQYRNQIRQDMEVIAQRGKHIGTVKEVRMNDFLVDRDMARDVYVPFSAIRNVDDKIRLGISADEVDKQGWPMPDIIGNEGQMNR